jgi:hypothetical protein
MATVWIKRIYNYSGGPIILKTNDGTWHPIIDGHRYMQDEPIQLEDGTATTADHFFIPWSDWGRLRIENPASGRAVEWRVGPPPNETYDALRGWDDQGNEVGSLPVGDRGSWWSASTDLDLLFTDATVRWTIVAQMNVKEQYLKDFAMIAQYVEKAIGIVLGLKKAIG